MSAVYPEESQFFYGSYGFYCNSILFHLMVSPTEFNQTFHGRWEKNYRFNDVHKSCLKQLVCSAQQDWEIHLNEMENEPGRG